MQVLSIPEFIAQHNFVQVCHTVRENTNSYPFVTFINKDNQAENVYFSKAAAQDVTAGTPIVKGFFAGYSIAYVQNDANEQRIKIISNSERLELSAIL
jgi:hypothetical protein